jgi:hypothetical protein
MASNARSTPFSQLRHDCLKLRPIHILELYLLAGIHRPLSGLQANPGLLNRKSSYAASVVPSGAPYPYLSLLSKITRNLTIDRPYAPFIRYTK